MSAEGKKKTRAPKKAKPEVANTDAPETPRNPAAHLAKFQVQPGQVLNPKGRPKGSRNKLGESFLTDLQADWETNGASVIETVRKDRPHEYLKVVASILPKELNVRVDPLDEMDDDELTAILAAARAACRLHQEGRGDAGETEGGKPPGVLLS